MALDFKTPDHLHLPRACLSNHSKIMANAALGFILCDNEAAAQSALATLATCQTLAIDCEGKELGTKGGQLSLINVRPISSSESSQSTFIFDVLGVSKSALRPLFDLLESQSVKKVMFDGRMDFSALYHEQNVSLRNVLDIQITDVMSRKVKGEGVDKQLSRLSPYISRKNIERWRSSYLPIQRLSGLSKCFEEHGMSVKKAVNGEQRSTLVPTMCSILCSAPDHNQWLTRPLSIKNLEYAANDVRMISSLHQHFVNGYLIFEPELTEQSLRYITLHRDTQPVVNDPYRGHPLLPLEIVNVGQGERRTCQKCHRDLCRSSFSASAWGKAKSSWKNANTRMCWVCRAIDTKIYNRRRWEQAQRETLEADPHLDDDREIGGGSGYRESGPAYHGYRYKGMYCGYTFDLDCEVNWN